MGVPDRFQALVDDRSASQAPDAWLDLAEAATAEDAAEALDHLLATDRAGRVHLGSACRLSGRYALCQSHG